MAHAQKPDLVFLRNGRVHLNRHGASVQSTTGSRGVRISGSNAGYTMFRGSVKITGYPLHSPVSPLLLVPCVTVCHHISTELYLLCTEESEQHVYTVWSQILFVKGTVVTGHVTKAYRCGGRCTYIPLILKSRNLKIRVKRLPTRPGRSTLLTRNEISITYPGCGFPALVTQHAMRISRIILSSVACPALPNFSPHHLISGKIFG